MKRKLACLAFGHHWDVMVIGSAHDWLYLWKQRRCTRCDRREQQNYGLFGKPQSHWFKVV